MPGGYHSCHGRCSPPRPSPGVLLPGLGVLSRYRGHRAAPCSHLWFPEGPSGQPPLQTLTVRLRCEGIWVRKQTSQVDIVLGEERKTCCVFPGTATAMPSSCHGAQGDMHQGQEALSHVFSPVPVAWGHSPLSCDQDQAPSLATGAESLAVLSHPGAGTCPWHWGGEGTAPTPVWSSAGLRTRVCPVGSPAA